MTPKFDKSLLQNVSLQSKANIFFANDCIVSFVLSLSTGFTDSQWFFN